MNNEKIEYVEAYENLANAIIARAAEDYRIAYITNNVNSMKRIENFFHSQQYSMYTNVDGDYILQKVRESCH